MKTIGIALVMRECAAIAASRVLWIFTLVCATCGLILAGTTMADRTALWLALPMMLYLVPLLGLLAGVSAARGDHEEEAMIALRAPAPILRLTIKLLLWSLLLAIATLAWLLPAAIKVGHMDRLPLIWAYALGEMAVFVAIGLALGRLLQNEVIAHLGALLFGFVFVSGAGVIAWILAQTPTFQGHPALWTLGLMLHPVEALRVGLMMTMENLPFDKGHLPELATWWLDHTGWWYALLVFAWSLMALLLATWRKPSV